MDTRVKAVIGGFLVLGLGVTIATDRATGLLERRYQDALAALADPAPPPVLPAIELGRPGPLAALFSDRDRQPTLAPTPPPAAAAPEPTRKTSPVGACLFGGMAGAGTALVIGPAEIGALIAGAALVPATAPLIGIVLGGAFVAGCTGTALLVPAVGGPP